MAADLRSAGDYSRLITLHLVRSVTQQTVHTDILVVFPCQCRLKTEYLPTNVSFYFVDRLTLATTADAGFRKSGPAKNDPLLPEVYVRNSHSILYFSRGTVGMHGACRRLMICYDIYLLRLDCLQR